MRLENLEEVVELPEGVSAQLEKRVLTITGPNGALTRPFNSKRVVVSHEDSKIRIKAPIATKREKMLLRTFRAHIKNMVRGVTEGHEYKLKVCSGHFPMNVAIKDGVLTVKNFIGEAVPRTMAVVEGVDVKINGEDIVVSGTNKEDVARIAARIEGLTRRPGFDTRIFQDGIYIVEKDGKKV